MDILKIILILLFVSCNVYKSTSHNIRVIDLFDNDSEVLTYFLNAEQDKKNEVIRNSPYKQLLKFTTYKVNNSMVMVEWSTTEPYPNESRGDYILSHSMTWTSLYRSNNIIIRSLNDLRFGEKLYREGDYSDKFASERKYGFLTSNDNKINLYFKDDNLSPGIYYYTIILSNQYHPDQIKYVGPIYIQGKGCL